MKILTELGYSFTTTAEREIGRGVKEKLCYIAFDYNTELKSTVENSDKKQTHMLSDGNIITVALNVSVASVFFQPSVIGKEASGVNDFFPEQHKVRLLHPQRFCTPMSCCHAARTCSKRF